MIKRETKSAPPPTPEEISRRAYEIFVQRGRPNGRDLDHWLEAEAELRAAVFTKTPKQPARRSAATRSAATRGKGFRTSRSR